MQAANALQGHRARAMNRSYSLSANLFNLAKHPKMLNPLWSNDVSDVVAEDILFLATEPSENVQDIVSLPCQARDDPLPFKKRLHVARAWFLRTTKLRRSCVAG